MEIAGGPSEEEIALFERWFKRYDSNGDGNIDKEDVKTILNELTGFPKDDCQKMFMGHIPEEKEKWVFEEIKPKINVQEKLPKVFALLETVKATQLDAEVQDHNIRLSVGADNHYKTKFDLKAFLNDEMSTKLFADAAKGLNLKKDDITLILKFHSDNPKIAQDKFEDLVKETLLYMRVSKCPPGTPQCAFLDSLLFDYNCDSNSVSIGIHTNHKLVEWFVDYSQVVGKVYKVDQLKALVDLQVYIRNDLHKLISDNPADRDVLASILAGGSLSLEIQSNFHKLIKNAIRPFMKKIPLFAILMAFLQKGSHVELGLDDIDIEAFFEKPEDAKLPKIDLFDDQAGGHSKFVAFQGVTNTGIPAVDKALDLFENHVIADVQLTINTPHIFITSQLKTSGVKEMWSNMKTLV
jgi:hypothetical protein